MLIKILQIFVHSCVGQSLRYIVNGKLTHKDTLGTEETLGRGSVQFMTAGKGVQHSEFNLQKEESLRFIQTWIVPRRNGLQPNYGSFNPIYRDDVCTARNNWRHLVSDVQDKSTNTPVQIEQDANLFVAEMDDGQSLQLYPIPPAFHRDPKTQQHDGSANLIG